MHPHTATVRPLFQFQRLQTSTPRHEQSRRSLVPIGDIRELILIGDAFG